MDITQIKKMIRSQEKGSKIRAEDVPFATGKAPQCMKVSEENCEGKITITGVARNAVLGAVVQKDGGGVLYIDGLSEWDDSIAGKRVEVRGTLVTRKLAPDPVVDKDGGISHGMAGSAGVIEGAVWKII
jgi:hypothetical protein